MPCTNNEKVLYEDGEADLCDGDAYDSDDDGYEQRLNYHIDEYYTRCYGTEEVDLKEPEKWTWFRMGDAALMVSDEGKIRCPRKHFVSYGYAIPGSPYSSYPVAIDKFEPPVQMYVHDIVWRAFNGDIPKGYEVRHSMWVIKERQERYSNSITALDIYRKIVGGKQADDEVDRDVSFVVLTPRV